MLDLTNYNYLFYDFETTGQNPCFDQAVRLAIIETDSQFNIINKHNIDIKLRNDILPHPKALLVNKLNIEDLNSGNNEYESFKKIHKIFNQPDKISIGYNSLSFDDKFLRFGFYRNLLEPYNHHNPLKGNNFRADLYNMIFIYYLYKNEESIIWPIVNNRLSLKLENINSINNLYEGMSHDAEVDVHVTIELAKKLHSIDPKMWNYLILNFIKNNEKNNFNKLPTMRCINDDEYRVGILISNKIGLKSNYCAPVIYLCDDPKQKGQIYLLRLDQYDFTNFKSKNFASKINKGIISKKFGEPNFIIPFTDQYFKSINEHIIALAKENINWIKHNPEGMHDLIKKKKADKYDDIQNIDLDASLYELGFFTSDENKYINLFHETPLKDKSSYIINLPNGRVKELAIRIMGRNYFNDLSDDLVEHYNKYLNSILHQQSDRPDFRNNFRHDPFVLLSETKDLLKKKDLDERDSNILNSLKDLISLKTRKQQDLGF